MPLPNRARARAAGFSGLLGYTTLGLSAAAGRAPALPASGARLTAWAAGGARAAGLGRVAGARKGSA